MGSTSKTVILSRPTDWEPWFFTIKSLAEGGKVWELIDPDLATEPAVPAEPEIPTATQVNRNKNSVVELDPDERELYKLLLVQHKEHSAKATKTLEALNGVRKHLITTVATDNLVYIRGKSTAYQMLQELKKRLAPTDYARKMDAILRYNRLKTFSKQENVEKWLKEWEVTYTDASVLEIAEAAGERPLFDFTHAITAIDAGFASTQEYFINQKINKGETPPDIYSLIEDFRNHYRRSEALRQSASHSGFATLRGEPQDSEKKGQDAAKHESKRQPRKESEGQDSNPPRRERFCLCGDKHGKSSRWEDCDYINPSKRPDGWKGSPETFDRINKSISRWIQGKLDWFLEKFKYDGLNPSQSTKHSPGTSRQNGGMLRQRETPRSVANRAEQMLGSFITHSSFSSKKYYKLYNAWTLDNASDTHVCNDATRSGFTKTREAGPDDRLFAGKTAYPIEGFGTAYVPVQTQDGIREIELKNVALAPGFMTNLVCLRLLNIKGVHWNSEIPNRLAWEGGAHFCDLEWVDDHLVLQRDTELTGNLQQNTDLHEDSECETRGSFGIKQSAAKRLTKFTPAQMHCALGHASPEVIAHIESAGSDIEIVKTDPAPATIDCEACSLSKATEIISRSSDVEQPENGIPFDRSTWDLIEHSTGYNGDRYTSHFQCRQYLFNLVFTHPRKSDAKLSFEKALSIIEGQFGGKIRFLRLDGETSLGNFFENLVIEKQIKPERTAPHTPAQNGGAERSGRVIVTKARTMRIAANLPADLWPEVIKAAGYISNRTPVRKLGWQTPFEAITKVKPHFAHLNAYGCRAYPLNHKIPRRSKLDPRAHIGHLVGYDSTNIFRIWVPSRNKVIRTRDVTFDNSLFYDPSTVDIGILLREEVEDIIESLEIPEIRVHTEENNNSLLEMETRNISEACDVQTPVSAPPQICDKSTLNSPGNQYFLTPSLTPEAGTSEQPSQAPEEMIIVQSGQLSKPPEEAMIATSGQSSNPSKETIVVQPKKNSRVKENRAPNRDLISADPNERFILPGRTRRSAHVAMIQQNRALRSYHSAFGSIWKSAKPKGLHRDSLPPPPKSWKQMLKHPYKEEFLQAAEKEYRGLESKGTFEYIAENDPRVQNSNQKPLPLMWTFVYKFDENGFLNKFKARLVARGDLQSTEEDTYAATLAAQIFRAVTAITAAFDLEMRQFDAVNAFANANLPTPLLCPCAEGYEQPGSLLWITKAIYGLKTSAVLWYRDFTSTLKKLGLTPVPDACCLYFNEWLTLIFYVDDIIAIYSRNNKDKMDEFETRFTEEYELRKLGEAKHFLGIRILRDRTERKLWLIQDSYIDKLGERFNCATVEKPPKTPIMTDLVPFTGTATPQQIYGYQQKVGSLNFAAIISRPDISKAVSRLSEFLQNPSPDHIAAADRTLQYLVGSKFLAIQYDGNQTAPGHRVFVTSSDSAFADDPLTRNSSYGYCFSLFGGMIHYKAVKGKTVTTSSTEAELLALSQTAKNFLWWMRIFICLEFNPQEKSTIYCDNIQTIRLLTKETPKLQTALKHVDIHQSWLRQEVQSGSINVEWVPTTQMVADGFTKILPPQRHEEFLRQLNLVNIKRILEDKENGTGKATRTEKNQEQVNTSPGRVC